MVVVEVGSLAIGQAEARPSPANGGRDREQQCVEVADSGLGETGSSETLAQRLARVSSAVVAHDVLRAPQHRQGRDGYQQHTPRLDQARDLGHASGVVVQVFQHIQSQDRVT